LQGVFSGYGFTTPITACIRQTAWPLTDIGRLTVERSGKLNATSRLLASIYIKKKSNCLFCSSPYSLDTSPNSMLLHGYPVISGFPLPFLPRSFQPAHELIVPQHDSLLWPKHRLAYKEPNWYREMPSLLLFPWASSGTGWVTAKHQQE
jgi:hypothetical protein